MIVNDKFVYVQKSYDAVCTNYKLQGALGGAHVPPTKLFPRLAVNKTILKPRVAAATGAQ